VVATIGGILTAGPNRACSNRRDRENKHDNSEPSTEGKFPLRNSYAMNVDQGNRNCYACRGFEHLARNCRNQRIGMSRRIETENNTNNLNREGGLGSPN